MKNKKQVCKHLFLLVGATGFEPATLCSQSRCATGLRYAPKFFGTRNVTEFDGKCKCQQKTTARQSAGRHALKLALAHYIATALGRSLKVT